MEVWRSEGIAAESWPWVWEGVTSVFRRGMVVVIVRDGNGHKVRRGVIRDAVQRSCRVLVRFLKDCKYLPKGECATA